MEDARRRGQEGGIRAVTADAFGELAGYIVKCELSVIENDNAVGEREKLLCAVLADQHRHARLAVEAVDGLDKARRGDRVELCRRLVEQEQLGVGDHHRR